MSKWLRDHNGGDPPPTSISVKRVQQLEQVEKDYYDLQAEYHKLETKVQKLEDKLQTQRKELKRLQAADFASRKKTSVKSHDVISQSLDEIFSKSVDWSREYFKIDFRHFSIDEFPSLKKYMEWVSWEDSNWRAKKFLNVSHLVQAMIADLLATDILQWPFDGCEKGFLQHCGDLYEVMLNDNTQEASRWRAKTLSAYEKFGQWPPPLQSQSAPSKSVTWHRERYYDSLVTEIDNILRPITHKHFPGRGDDEERLRRCREFVKAAGDLAVELGRNAAELRVVNKDWFSESARTFICDDDRMKDRFGEDDIDSRENPRVDIILRPGLLKYGNDEGENFDNYSVWIPALVDLSRGSTSQADSKKPVTRASKRPTADDPQPHETPPAEHHSEPSTPKQQAPKQGSPAAVHDPISVDSEYIDRQMTTTPPTPTTPTD